MSDHHTVSDVSKQLEVQVVVTPVTDPDDELRQRQFAAIVRLLRQAVEERSQMHNDAGNSCHRA